MFVCAVRAWPTQVLHVDLRRRSRQVGEGLEPHPSDVVKRALNALLVGEAVRRPGGW
jgi:hypothetical protein